MENAMRSAVMTIVCSLLIVCAAPIEASLRAEVLAGPVEGEIISILDGDTVTVRLKVWIGQSIETSVRIAGIDTPEMRGKCAEERQLATDARAEIIRLLPDNRIRLYNIRLEKYAGRVLAEAKTTDGTDIARHMVEKGFARDYHGARRTGWCP
jgi:endonuclease YncB( thermonuclease family)